MQKLNLEMFTHFQLGKYHLRKSIKLNLRKTEEKGQTFTASLEKLQRIIFENKEGDGSH